MKRSGLYNNAIFIQCKTFLSNFEDFIPAFKTCYLMNENHETGSACKSSALWVMQMCRWKALSFVTSSLKIQNHHHFKLGKKKKTKTKVEDFDEAFDAILRCVTYGHDCYYGLVSVFFSFLMSFGKGVNKIK